MTFAELAKLCIVSPQFKCSNEILSLVAMLSIPNVFSRPNALKKEADIAKAQFIREEGDHLTLLNVYHAYKNNQHDNQWAWNNFLNLRSLQSADNIRAQLKRTMEKHDLDLVSTAFEDKNYYTNMRKALTSAFFMHVAHKEGEKGSYLTVKDNQVASIHPSSGLDSQPEWIIYDEHVLSARSVDFTCVFKEMR